MPVFSDYLSVSVNLTKLNQSRVETLLCYWRKWWDNLTRVTACTRDFYL